MRQTITKSVIVGQPIYHSHTMLEIIVIGALCLAGMGLAVKLGIHVKSWMTNRTDMIREKKLTKTAKMRKAILEEYQNGFPAHPESSEEKVELG